MTQSGQSPWLLGQYTPWPDRDNKFYPIQKFRRSQNLRKLEALGQCIPPPRHVLL